LDPEFAFQWTREIRRKASVREPLVRLHSIFAYRITKNISVAPSYELLAASKPWWGLAKGFNFKYAYYDYFSLKAFFYITDDSNVLGHKIIMKA
jgi:hypothetical protein